MIPLSVLQWKPQAQKWSALHPPVLTNEILAIICCESSGNPNAFNPNDPSRGLMQIEPPIAKAFGGVTDQDQLFNPELNIMIGSSFLAHLKATYSDHFPNWVTGYNQGETNLRKGYPDQDYWDAFNKYLAELNSMEETST